MNTIHRLLSYTTNDTENSTWGHVLLWVLVTVGALLLVGFTSVVDDFAQHGEMRRMQQRVSGSFVLPGEIMPSGSVDAARLLSSREENLASR